MKGRPSSGGTPDPTEPIAWDSTPRIEKIYPSPPRNFVMNSDVEMLWARYEQYVMGDVDDGGDPEQGDKPAPGAPEPRAIEEGQQHEQGHAQTEAAAAADLTLDAEGG